MLNVSNFLKSLDKLQMDEAIDEFSLQRKTDITTEELVEFAKSAKIDSFKKKELVEYMDANKDKLLARVEFNNLDPVRISDDFAPAAGKHGVVMAKGEGTTFRVKFDDSELDIPEEHLIHSPAPAQTSYPAAQMESKAFVLTAEGVLNEVVLESQDIDSKLICEQFEQEVLAIIPIGLNEEQMQEFFSIANTTLNEDQIKLRDSAMFTARLVVEKLEEAFGDSWTEMLFAAATDMAIHQSDLLESTPEEDQAIFDANNPEGDSIKIYKHDDGFHVSITDKRGDVLEDQKFDKIEEAEALAQRFM